MATFARWLLPVQHSVSFTLRIFGAGLVLCALVAVAGVLARRRRLAWTGVAGAAAIGACWLGLYATRPPWLRYALADPAPSPTVAPPTWTERAPGLETADLDLTVAGD